MPSVEWNRAAWSQRHGWEQHGDEWSGMAAACGQPYEQWKAALVETFIVSSLTPTSDVLEIAPGHGRWTEHLLAGAGSVEIVDINQDCLDVCRVRFDDDPRLRGHLTTGSSLEFIATRSIGFVWSFDSFVHMDSDVIKGYLNEFARVIRPGGRAIIHHAGIRPWALPLAPTTRRLGVAGRVVQRLAGQGRLRDSGNRSMVSREQVAGWAGKVGFTVERQTQSWGDQGQYDVRKYGDWITILQKPAAAV